MPIDMISIQRLLPNDPFYTKKKKNSDPSKMINFLELLAILVACKLWAPRMSKMKVVIPIKTRITTDSQVSVHIIHKMKAKAGFLRMLLREFVITMVEHNFLLTLDHIDTLDNKIADGLSRRDQSIVDSFSSCNMLSFINPNLESFWLAQRNPPWF